MWLYIVIIFLFLLYAGLIVYYTRAWRKIALYKTKNTNPATSISIIIPARNEEASIGTLLRSLQEQDYPKHLFELIVVDDHSTDNTTGIVQQYSTVKLLQLKEEDINSYKKKAVETGIAAATGSLIVCTDADCVVPPGWLSAIASYKEENASVFIAAPVVINNKPSFVQFFQALDFMILQGITGAAVSNHHLSMCNGANLAYEKEAFYKVNGFEGIDAIASGDDMLLMHKIAKQYPGKVHYLKSPAAIVSTAAVPTWKAFFSQRIRWASKAGKYDDKRIFWVLLLVYLFNLSFLVLLAAGCWLSEAYFFALLLLVAKTVVELPFAVSVATFFIKQSLLKYFPFFQPLHILYTVISGLFGQFGKYEWKGRKVR
ncbi:MAG TPA: glycosyltransferase [Chitinophagaceae bacterium]|jgi:cellulose synthase/poly-beta-1,6-N-acetylglucosamine synthase-like glycosyltransferase|nr:glycosyltransferase [Chitinophagaceae bacterium]